MANPPDRRNKPPKKTKDPARPTRAKAAREALPPIAPALADLPNPCRNRGEAGVGSQTGLNAPSPGRQAPPDNSRDRRADFAAAHRARASTPDGLSERPQAGYVGKSPLQGRKTPVGPGEIDPDLARALGLVDEEDENSSQPGTTGEPAGNSALQDALRLPRVIPLPGEGDASAAAATASALDALLREGRPEFRDQPWVPHRPPRPEKSEGGQRFVIKSDFAPKGDQPQAIAELVEGVKRSDRTQVLLGVTGSGNTFTMAQVFEATQRPALILFPIKTLAAQLYHAFSDFIPDNYGLNLVSY